MSTAATLTLSPYSFTLPANSISLPKKTPSRISHYRTSERERLTPNTPDTASTRSGTEQNAGPNPTSKSDHLRRALGSHLRPCLCQALPAVIDATGQVVKDDKSTVDHGCFLDHHATCDMNNWQEEMVRK